MRTQTIENLATSLLTAVFLKISAVLDLGIDQGGGIPHQAEKGGGIGNKVGASFNRFLIKFLCDYSTYTL